MAASTFKVSIAAAQIQGLADKLSTLTPETLGQVLVGAINETVESAYDLSRRAILRGVNLTDDYVQQHMTVQYATSQNPTASIVAFGGRGFYTNLSHYGAIQEKQAALHPSRSKGDPARGIAAGQKAAGVSVEVTQGSRKPITHGFTLPGKKDREGNLLVFTRANDGKVKSRLGPSVYQLFRVAGALVEDQVTDDLGTAVANAAEKQFLKGLE